MKRLPMAKRQNGLNRFLPAFLVRHALGAQGLDSATQTCSPVPDAPLVLVIDDDEVFLTTTSMKLRSAGYSVATAKDGSDAIRSIGVQSPDFILLDINFPPDVSNGGMVCWDGFRIMYWLRGLENAQRARFVITSGDTSPDAAARARAAGAIAFFPKPIDHSALLSLFREELKRGSARAL